jgi:hypothetical protein
VHVAVASLFGMAADSTAHVAVPAIPRKSTIIVGACKFEIENMFGGKFIVPSTEETAPQQGVYDLPDTGPNASSVIGSFALFCVDASDEKIDTMLDARQVNGKWFKYNPWAGPNEPEWKPFDQRAHARTVEFNGSNWTGTGLTVDATTGDEERRARTFRFCLIHQMHALCGKSPVQWLADPRKRNELWKIKAILQSIEFVDTSSSVESNPTGGSASPPER